MENYRIIRRKIINPYESNTEFSPELNGSVYFKEISLKQKSVSFLHANIVKLHISYKLDTWSKGFNTDFTLGNCLFGAVKVTKNANPNKCKCSSCGIEFDLRSQFSWTGRSSGKKCFYFWS